MKSGVKEIFFKQACFRVQYGDGLLGPIVFNYPPGEDPVLREYSYIADYTVILQDWIHEYGEELELLYKGPYWSL